MGQQSNTASFPAEIDLADLDGKNGFELKGVVSPSYAGRSVSGAGDVNGDGFDDVIIGAPYAYNYIYGVGRDFVGQGYVVFGKASGFPETLLLSELDGSNGFTLDGVSNEQRSGHAVSGTGDVNGDGFDDLIIGARSDGDISKSYVVFGAASGFPATLNLADLDGDNGLTLNGVPDRADWSFEVSVGHAGDVNGDGFDDILIGDPAALVTGYYSPDYAPGFDVTKGQSYVVFGRDTGYPASVDLGSLDAETGFALNGVDGVDDDRGDNAGSSVAGAGDVNGDGFDDLIIGALSGQVYVIFGSDTEFPAELELESLDGRTGFALVGAIAPFPGTRVNGAGDVNGDGFDDLIIGADSADANGTNSGRSYVVFGAASGFPETLDLADLDGINGFVLNGASSFDFSGSSVSGGGDFNGDGFDDLIIGAPGVGSGSYDGYEGQSYLVFGTASHFPATIELADLDGSNGFALNGVSSNDRSGSSVSGAGDVNGDGFDDLIIGAPTREPNSNTNVGQGYVVFGGPYAPPQNFPGLLEIDRDGSKVVVTATSRDGKAELDGMLDITGGTLSNFKTVNVESNDVISSRPRGVDFDLITWDVEGAFDRFEFNVAEDAVITAHGTFDVVFTGDPGGSTKPKVSLSATPETGSEADGTVITLTATASKAVDGDQTVALALSGSASAADFVGVLPTEITIENGQTEASVTVTVENDSAVEEPETATFTISNPTAGIELDSTTSTSVAVMDDDTPSQNFPGLLEIDRDGSKVVVTATSRDGKAELDGMLDFINGTLSNFKTVNLESNDAIASRPEWIAFDLITWDVDGAFDRFEFNLDEDALIIVSGAFDVVFTGDPGGPAKPKVSLSATPEAGSEADGTVITLTATVSEAVEGEQTVALALSGSASAADFMAVLPTEITIPNGQTEASVTVTVENDIAVEGPETAVFTISNPTAGIELDATRSTSVVIVDDDAPPQDYPGLLQIDRDGSKVVVTATSRDGKAELDGMLDIAGGTLANFKTINVESNDVISSRPDGVDFELITWDVEGAFDRFEFSVGEDAFIAANGTFDVVFV